ncbi:MAG TPA: acetolactate decarboxylase [Ignavibacteria bacterium]|nr:acetolactate decarboxylase [Ignavibacteria bacterium]HMR41111.1 acetolactate decarboxylase [Ignavibacteria bacterium]
MKNSIYFYVIIVILTVILTSCKSFSQNNEGKAGPQTNSVKITGEMKNVMWKGELYGTIDIDTISDKEHLYGLGPVEYLRGEIIIVDGRGYKSTVINDSTMDVSETLKLKAPIFAYANIENWTESNLPDNILSMSALEKFLDQNSSDIKKPFLFKLTGTADSAEIHIVNLEEGSIVSSPEEAHKGQKNFIIKDKRIELVGFYSTEHKAIFTHHDTNIHIHLITEDKKQMGHLEKIDLKKGTVKLYLPKQ